MINELHSLIIKNQKNDKFYGEKLLLDFIASRINPNFNFYFELDPKSIKLNHEHDISLSRKASIKNIEDGYASGVYCFKHIQTGKFGIGSSISCVPRLRDHISSFNGHRSTTFLHEWINANGGIASACWSPIITYPNVYQEWHKQYPLVKLSKGGHNLLRAFSLYSARILEQAVLDFYKPFLNDFNIVSFFNFSLIPNDFLKDQPDNIYQVWDIELNNLILTSNSLKDLAHRIGIARSTVKSYLNWHEGLDITIEGENIKAIIREEGIQLRNYKVKTQLTKKKTYPQVELIGRSLYDLQPGLSYVIDPKTTKDVYGPFNSRLELFQELFPAKWAKLTKEEVSSGVIRNLIANNVTINMNLSIPGGIKTEKGSFLYCCNPDHPFILNRIPKPLYSITTQGLCTWYSNNSSILNIHRNYVTKLRLNLEEYKGVRLLDESVLLNLFPNIPKGKGSVYQLSPTELIELNHYISNIKLSQEDQEKSS
nr:hypothetical protein [Grifola frondosa]